MKHRRGIELSSPEIDGVDAELTSLGALPSWYVLAAECSRCRNRQMIDRWEMARKFGKGTSLAELSERLTCKCGNKEQNRLLLGRLPRD